jgi:hypothetical protein
MSIECEVRLKMPTRKDFKMELYRMMNEAIHQGKTTADINAGELHRRTAKKPNKHSVFA